MTLRQQAAFWLFALLGLIGFLWLLRDILLPFIMGAALAFLLDPLADWLQRTGMNRLWATVTILVLSLVLFVIALTMLIPILAAQLATFLERLPGYVTRLQELFGTLLETRLGTFLETQDVATTVEGLVRQGAGWIGAVIGSVWAGGRAVFDILGIFIVTPVVAFYLLLDWDRMVAKLDNLMPRDHLATIRTLARDVNRALAGFVRGQGTVCVILGLFYAASLTLVGLNFGLLIGVVSGIISFIPFVGSIIGFLLSVGVALVQFWPDWIWVGAVVGIFGLGQFIEGNILQPRFVGSSIGVHPVWLMFALFAFGSLFGFVGTLLAVPATAAIGVLVRFALGQYQRSRIYWGGGAAPDDVTRPPFAPPTSLGPPRA